MASCLIDVYYHHSSISLRARLYRIVLIRNGAFDVFESTVGLVEIPDAILDRADTLDLNLGALLLLIFNSSQSLFNCSTIQGLLYICSQSTPLPLHCIIDAFVSQKNEPNFVWTMYCILAVGLLFSNQKTHSKVG